MSEEPKGSYLHIPERQHSHCCPLPQLITFGPIVRGVPSATQMAAGTVWQCDCDQVWVVVYEPPHRHGSMHMAGGNVWRRETRHQRRKRFGLRWWQQEAR